MEGVGEAVVQGEEFAVEEAREEGESVAEVEVDYGDGVVWHFGGVRFLYWFLGGGGEVDGCLGSSV